MDNSSGFGHLVEKGRKAFDLERHPGATTDPRGNRAYSDDIQMDRKMALQVVVICVVVFIASVAWRLS